MTQTGGGSNIWIILALGSALCLASSDALTARVLRDNEDEALVGWGRLVFSLPVLLVLWLSQNIPLVDATFYKAFLISLPLEIITVFLYIKALKVSPLSLTLPFLSLTPMFLLLASIFVFNETLSSGGVTGVMLIVIGGYILNAHAAKRGILEPLKAIVREKGSLYMIAVAFIYSITSSLGKIAIEHSSPLFFGTTYFLSLTVAITPLCFWYGRNNINRFFKKGIYLRLILPGLFYGAMIVFHMLSLDLANVAYMISVKRLSLLIGVLYGRIFFKEKNFRERLLGATFMFAGFVLIVHTQ